MKRRVVWIGAGVAALVLGPMLVGCEGTGGKRHVMAGAQQADLVLGCQKCYSATIDARRSSLGATIDARRRSVKPGGPLTTRKHMCPDCKGEMRIYTEGETPMIQCTTCVPEGVACNRCLPPEEGS